MLAGHGKQWDFLKRRFEQDQLSHAYLFAGESQLGKRTFAEEFVKLINCLAEKEKPCQKCQNCRMIEKGSFPDLLTIKSDESEIKIDRIREAQNFLSYKSYYGSFKAVIADGAEKMNQEAQSCFLKTLEEPKGRTIIILISSRPEAFLPTIISRCQTVKFFPIGSRAIKDFLEKQGVNPDKAETLSFVSEGKPGRAQDFISNPDKAEKEKELLGEALKAIGSGLSEKFRYAKNLDLESQGLKEILAILTKYFRFLLFSKMGIIEPQKEGHFNFIEAPAVLRNYPALKIKEIINFIEHLNRQALSTNASPKLALEILLMEI